MSTPLVIDLPHKLGREEARRRIKARLGDLERHLPGGNGTVATSWTGEDQLAVRAHALGQDVAATVDIGDDVVRVALALPFMLSFMSGPIKSAIQTKGAKLLEPKSA